MASRLRVQMLAFMAGILCAGLCYRASAASLCSNIPSKVDFQTSFVPYAGDVAVFVAREKGFFSELGININIIPGAGSASTTTNIDQGKVLFGGTSATSLIVNRSKGQKVKIVAALTEGTPQAWATLNPAIKSPKEFEGHSVGVGPGTGDALVLPILMRINGGDVSKVNVVSIAPSVYSTALLNGQVEIVPGYLDGAFVSISRVAKEQGKTAYVVSSGANNLDTYHLGLAASESTIAENPCLVRAYVQASMRGLDYAAKHPSEAANILVEAVPTLNPADPPDQLRELDKITDRGGFSKNGYGHIDPAKMAETVKIVSAAYGITEQINPADIYTNEFLK